jgi:transcriptional regulator with XRE-family HTH domain
VPVHERVKRERVKRSLSQTDLALLLNMGKSRLCRIESGELKLYADDVWRIAKAFQIPVGRLYGERG